MEPGGQVLFSFVRFWSRRWTGAGFGVDAERGRDVMVVEAVHALSTPQAPSRAPALVSVNDIAHELGIDQSGASRMVARAERLKLLSRSAPGGVGKRSSIALTPAGEDLLRQAHAWQDDVFGSLTAGWSKPEVRTFLSLMGRLVAAQLERDTR